MIRIKVTVFYEKKYWVATFERIDKKGYAVAKHIFGKEPTDPEIHQFVLNHYDELHFGPAKEFELEIKRMNPKRVQRKVRKEMEQAKKNQRPSTLAQEYMRQELEKKKERKKHKSATEKKARIKEQFAKKQAKKKQKQKGH